MVAAIGLAVSLAAVTGLGLARSQRRYAWIGSDGSGGDELVVECEEGAHVQGGLHQQRQHDAFHCGARRGWVRHSSRVEEGKGCVGTPGLGYPLLLCLGKSLVVILNYVQQPDPCGPEP